MMQISGVKKVGKDNISCYCRDNNEMGNTPLVQCDWCLCWLHYSCLLRSGDIPGWNESLHPNVNLNYEVPVEPPHQLYCKRCVYLVTEFERDQRDYKDEIVLQENINSKRTGDQRKFKKILPKKKSSVLEKQLLQRAALNFQALGRKVLDEENLELGNSNSEMDNSVLENGVKSKFTKIVPRKDVKQIKAYSPNQEQIKGIENGKLIEHKIRKNLSSNNASKNHNISKPYITQMNPKCQRNSDTNINNNSQLINDQPIGVNAQESINDKLSEYYTKINSNKYLNKIINNPEVLNNDTVKKKGSLNNLKDNLVINNVSKQKEVVKERQTRSNKKK
ncbi:hypothetical protein K502DRAFT_61174 [Neoconidiobolus thromboides FSU 785]|nr:hypothetical protein K502DRAFT_61174 [Neoconidiobolus thromboides FSU 785]